MVVQKQKWENFGLNLNQIPQNQLVPNGHQFDIYRLMLHFVYLRPTLNIEHKLKHNLLFKY